MATTTSTPLKAAASQPATGVGSLAETNRLIAATQTQLNGGGTSGGSSYTPDQVSQINSAREANVNAGVNAYSGAGATAASDAAGKGSGVVSSAPIAPPATPTNTPVDTNQPSPTKVDATPYTNPVVSAAQAQANLAQGGLTGTDLAAAQKSLSAYQQGHAAATASGVPAPQEANMGMSAATTAAGNATQTYVPPAPVQDALTEATQKYTDDFNNAMSTQQQGESLVNQYQDFTKQLGIPALNTELMNMKNVIDGTEDDIRNEVTKAGGFATDSQVLAMTNSRNKVMIQNYNNLLQTRSDAMQQIQTLTGLAQQDRQFAAQQLDQQLNFDQQQMTFATNAQKNAQQSYQNSAATFGWSGVLQQALATGDPNAVARVNATMGPGFDLQAAAAAPPSLDDQVKMANIAQSKAATAASYASMAGPAGTYQEGQNPTVDGWIKQINNGSAKISNVPKNLQGLVVQGLSGETEKSSELKTTALTSAQQLLNAFQNGQAGGGVVGGILGLKTPIMEGSKGADFVQNLNNVKSLLSLDNVKYLRGQGQVSDSERKLLEDASSQLSRSQSPDAFRKTLANMAIGLGAPTATRDGHTYVDDGNSGWVLVQ